MYLSLYIFLDCVHSLHQDRLIVVLICSICVCFRCSPAVPWPKNFRQFNEWIDVVNLDFLGVFVGSSCSFSVPPLHRFLLHMAIPLLLGVSLFSAYMTTRACCRTRACGGACGGRQYSNDAVDDLRGGGGDGSGQNQKIRAAESIQNTRCMTTTKSFMLFLLMMYPRYISCSFLVVCATNSKLMLFLFF